VRGFVVVDRAAAVEVDFLHRPVERAVGVAQRQGAEVAGDEDRNASVVWCRRRLPAFSSRSIAAPKVRPLSAVPDMVKVTSISWTNWSCVAGAALDAHLCRTAQRDVGGCYASSCHKGSRSEENLFHGFSLVFTLKVHLKTDIRIEYALLSLGAAGLQGRPGGGSSCGTRGADMSHTAHGHRHKKSGPAETLGQSLPDDRDHVPFMPVPDRRAESARSIPVSAPARGEVVIRA
jgi:hypothetical protein